MGAALSVGVAVFATFERFAAERDAARMVRIARLTAQLYGEAARLPAQGQDNGSKANSRFRCEGEGWSEVDTIYMIITKVAAVDIAVTRAAAC